METGVAISLILVAILLGIPLALYYLSQWQRPTVNQWQNGLLFKNGHFKKVVGPGRHWMYPTTTHMVIVERRPITFTVDALSVMASDGTYLVVSGIASLQVTDPLKAFESSENYYQTCFAELQAAIRKLLSKSSTVHTMHWGREAIAQQVLQEVNKKIEKWGLVYAAFEITELNNPRATTQSDEQESRAN